MFLKARESRGRALTRLLGQFGWQPKVLTLKFKNQFGWQPKVLNLNLNLKAVLRPQALTYHPAVQRPCIRADSEHWRPLDIEHIPTRLPSSCGAIRSWPPAMEHAA